MTQEPADRPTLTELVRTLDEDAFELHVDVTPSVLALIERGLDGAEAVLDRLNAPERSTRLHAWRVLEGVIARFFGWKTNIGYPDAAFEQRSRLAMDAIPYDVDASEPDRLAAIGMWRRWIAAKQAEQAKQVERAERAERDERARQEKQP